MNHVQLRPRHPVLTRGCTPGDREVRITSLCVLLLLERTLGWFPSPEFLNPNPNPNPNVSDKGTHDEGEANFVLSTDVLTAGSLVVAVSLAAILLSVCIALLYKHADAVQVALESAGSRGAARG